MTPAQRLQESIKEATAALKEMQHSCMVSFPALVDAYDALSNLESVVDELPNKIHENEYNECLQCSYCKTDYEPIDARGVVIDRETQECVAPDCYSCPAVLYAGFLPPDSNGK